METPHLKPYMAYAALSAVLYLVPVLIFILKDNYANAYLLYIGNALFAVGIVLAVSRYNALRHENALPVSMLSASMITSLIGVGIAFVLLLIFLLIDIPHLFAAAGAAKRMSDAPANIVHDSTNGLKFMVFLNDIIGNLAGAGMVAALYSFIGKQDQSGQTAEK
jgi:hypothetical protein